MSEGGWLAGALGAKKGVESKLQGVGKGVRQTVSSALGSYRKSFANAQSSPAGLKARQAAYYEGSGGTKPIK